MAGLGHVSALGANTAVRQQGEQLTLPTPRAMQHMAGVGGGGAHAFAPVGLRTYEEIECKGKASIGVQSAPMKLPCA
jgi:hypothetical protein